MFRKRPQKVCLRSRCNSRKSRDLDALASKEVVMVVDGGSQAGKKSAKSTAPATKFALQGPQRAARYLHFKVHEVLHLPRNLHFKVHKVLRLPRILHFKVHKACTKFARTCNSRSTKKYYAGHETCTSRPTKYCACHNVCTSMSTNCCTCHESCTSRPRSTAPATKYALQGPQSIVPATKPENETHGDTCP